MAVGGAWQSQLRDHGTRDHVDKDSWHNWPYVEELIYYYDFNKSGKL